MLAVMGRLRILLNAAVAAACIGGAAAAETAEDLLQQLADPSLDRWDRVERQVITEWSKSGSPAMDLLLRRGRAALDAGNTEAAIEHLTALIDHAPDFAEGWNTRAVAYFRAGQYGPAMSDLARTLELNPVHFGAIAGVGAILEETGRPEQALEAFRRAREIHPHQPMIRRAVERLEARVTGRDA
jgi:tetratricopeptide (TPR) repeat protein